MSWLLSRSELTAEQLRAVELPPTEHRLILGGPGAGKTQVLLHRTAFLRDRLGLKPQDYRLFVFTNVLSKYIRAGLDDLRIPQSCVSTFDNWCVTFHRKHLGPEPRSTEVDRWGRPKADYPGVRRAVLTHLEATRSEPLLACALVDEGQDLDEQAFRLLCRMARHVTVCMDRKQQIYEQRADEKAVLRQLGLRNRNLALLDALRCSPYVTELAAALVEDPEEGRAFSAQARTPQIERESPVLYLASDFEDERQRLIDVMQVRRRAGDRIGVLLPQKRQVFGFAKGLQEAGLDVEVQERVDFSTDLPKVLTYHSAKGLTFDSVMMPRLVNGSFPRLTQAQVERLMFVGVSRAVKWVYMSSTAARSAFAPFEKLRDLEQRGRLTVQRRGVAAPASSDAGRPSEPTETSDEEDWLDVL